MKTDSLQQRDTLLASLTFWEGRLTNKRLRELFSISSVRASEWIREFREAHPSWLELDTKSKSFVATAAPYRLQSNDLVRQQMSSSLSQYLNLVGLPPAPGADSGDHFLWAAFPDISPPQPQIFAVLTDAIRRGRVVSITYRSMREPAPHIRTLSPHNLVRAGRRWHVRAYCSESKGFRDYALRRIVSAKSLHLPAERKQEEDEAWMTKIPVRLIAHPLLDVEQQELIRFEYFNKTAARVDTCRGALVAYFVQDIRAALDPNEQRPPDYQLAVDNAAVVRPWVFG